MKNKKLKRPTESFTTWLKKRRIRIKNFEISMLEKRYGLWLTQAEFNKFKRHEGQSGTLVWVDNGFKQVIDDTLKGVGAVCEKKK